MKSGKIVVVGDGACGKTCLLEVFRRNKFPEEYVPTVVDNFVKVVKFDENKSVSLALWDTAGQEDYDTIRPITYHETDIFLLCYTIENKGNLDNISNKWLMEIKNSPSPSAAYFLVGLKMDLRFDPTVEKESLITPEEGQAIADEIAAEKFMECSARTRENVNEIFVEAARYIYENKKQDYADEGCWCSSHFFKWLCCCCKSSSSQD